MDDKQSQISKEEGENKHNFSSISLSQANPMKLPQKDDVSVVNEDIIADSRRQIMNIEGDNTNQAPKKK